MRRLLLTIFLLATFGFSQNTYELKDGTVVEGSIVSQTETEITLLTSFGEITIQKKDIIIKTYTVTMLSGEKLSGKKIYEDDSQLVIRNRYGDMELEKSDIQSITEDLSVTDNKGILKGDYRRPTGIFGLFSGQPFDKDSEFSLGEELLIDHFTDPTGHTLKRGDLYISGLSFGYGVTDRIQITSRFPNFIWGDINIRPKVNVLKIGNWEKEHSISIGGHYHTRWGGSNYDIPDKRIWNWNSGSVQITEFNGQLVTYTESENQCPDGSNEWTDSDGDLIYECWKQDEAATTSTKYWGGYYLLGEDATYEQEHDLPDGYAPNAIGEHYEHEPNSNGFDNCIGDYDDCDNDYKYYQMVELFGAYTFSSARNKLRGRVSHTLGANVKFVNIDDVSNFSEKLFFRYFYGLDVDINPKLKMLADIFYDKHYLELWQIAEHSNPDYWDESSFSDTPVEKPYDVIPVHIDFGFIYAFNESFRFGMHFQQPFISFYWKF